MPKLPKSWTTVTPFSKALALSMLVVFPILAFLLGVVYQQSLSSMYTPRTAVPFIGRFLLFLIPLLFVEMVLKGYALWNAGKNKQPGWFVVLFVVNSLGILPLIYLLCFRKKK